MSGGASGVVRSATYDEGYRAGLNQAIIELEAEATLLDQIDRRYLGDFYRALADRLRAVRDAV